MKFDLRLKLDDTSSEKKKKTKMMVTQILSQRSKYSRLNNELNNFFIYIIKNFNKL